MKYAVIAIVSLAVIAAAIFGLQVFTKPTSTLQGGNTVLDLSNQGLTQVGASVYDQTNLTELILSHNHIKSLPSQMGRLTSLAILKLDHNDLEGSLIAEIRQMPLRELDASYNSMTGVPAEIGQLKMLTKLDYSYNKITDLPNELANLKDNLKELKLAGNPLSEVTISKIKAELPNTEVTF